MNNSKILNIIEFIIVIGILLIGSYFNADKKIILFLGLITFLTFFPIFLKFKDDMENDIFYYKFHLPLSIGFIVSLILIIITQENLSKQIELLLYTSLGIFSLIYITIHVYTMRKYPEYYFRT